MNKKELQGTAREVKGKTEKNLGKVTGRKRTELHGAIEEARGKAEKLAGRAQAKVEHMKDHAKEAARDIA